jgi:hypothetical protein
VDTGILDMSALDIISILVLRACSWALGREHCSLGLGCLGICVGDQPQGTRCFPSVVGLLLLTGGLDNCFEDL